MLTAEIDDALRHIVIGTEVSRVLLDDGLPQFFDAADGRVFREAAFDGANAGVPDVFGRGKIRLARAQVHDVDALLA